jgi:AcrR family transcriptional regulator
VSRTTGTTSSVTENAVPPRRPVDRFAQRRDQLANAALQTLSELGYARTSLREIAQNSAFSHGVLHYYFTDKVDLITYCVRQYKESCVERYDQMFAAPGTAPELTQGFAGGLAQTLVEDTAMHRLWYDLRAQSLFEESFRADVAEIDHSLEQMIWRVVSRLADLTGTPPMFSSSVTYALFDGLFQQALLKHLSGDPDAVPEFEVATRDVLTRLVPG